MPTITLTLNGDAAGFGFAVCAIFPAVPPTHYDKLLSNDADTTYVENDQTNVTCEDFFTKTNTGLGVTDTINSLTFFAVAKKLSLGAPLTNALRFLMNIGGVEYSPVTAQFALTAAYALGSYVSLTNPATLAAWTASDIDAMNPGVRLTFGGGLPRLTWGRCTYYYLVVDYTPLVSIKLRRLLVGEGL